VLSVGLPFCVFKLLTGLVVLRLGGAWLRPCGVALVALGAIDAAVNLVNLVALVVAKRRVLGVCLTDVALGRRLGQDVALALDVFVSFALVAIVVGFGLLLALPRWGLPLWNVAVVLNVLGAGIGQLVTAVRRDAR
jgi:hypothetical protein